jgi:hypothetical protein
VLDAPVDDHGDTLGPTKKATRDPPRQIP